MRHLGGAPSWYASGIDQRSSTGCKKFASQVTAARGDPAQGSVNSTAENRVVRPRNKNHLHVPGEVTGHALAGTQVSCGSSKASEACKVVSSTTPGREDRGTNTREGGTYRNGPSLGTDGLWRIPVIWNGEQWCLARVSWSGKQWVWICEDDLPFSVAGISKWEVRHIGGNRGFAIVECMPENTPKQAMLEAAAPKKKWVQAQQLFQSPLYDDLYGDHTQSLTFHDGLCEVGSAQYHAELHLLCERDDVSHACVFKSLYALAERKETRDWLLGMSWMRYDAEGKRRGCEESEIWQLCRKWACMERTELEVYMAVITRTRHNKKQRGDLIRVRTFQHTQLDEPPALVLILVPTPGVVQGHALPWKKGAHEKKNCVQFDHCYVWTPAQIREPPYTAVPRAILENDGFFQPLGDQVPFQPDDNEEEITEAPKATKEEKGKGKLTQQHPDDLTLDEIDAFIEESAKKTTCDEATSSSSIARTDERKNDEASSSSNATMQPRIVGRQEEANGKAAPQDGAFEHLGYRGKDLFGIPFKNGHCVKRDAAEPYEDVIYTEVVENAVFDGIQKPPKCMIWRQGWWGPPPEREYSCTDYLDYELTFAKIASATQEYVRENGTHVYYLPVREEKGFVIQGSYVTDLAGNKDRILREGDVVDCRWTRYVVEGFTACVSANGVAEQVRLLRLRRQGSRKFLDVLGVPGYRVFWRNAVIRDGPLSSVIEKPVLRAIEYKAMAMVTDDPVQNMAIHAVRAEQGRKNFALDPKQVRKEVSEFLEGYKKLDLANVAGPFKWGYCYGGCGRERPSKFHGRLCPACSEKNTDLGEFVAQGHRVCSALNPVRYPGVVKTERKHFPLKKSAKSRVKLVGDPVTEEEERDGVVDRRISVQDFSGKELSMREVDEMPLDTKNGPRLGGVAIDGATPFTTAGGVRPLVEAIAYRVFKDLSVPDKRGYARQEPDKAAYKNAEKMLPVLLPRLWHDRILPSTIVAWINEMACRRRRDALSRCLMKWRRDGYILPQDWDVIKPFVKGENLPSIGTSDEWWYSGEIIPNGASYVARLIQAPHDVTHLIAGPYLRNLTRALKHEWGPNNWIFYGSVSPPALDQWLNRHRWANSWFWSDYSAFDATYSDEAWDLIECLYKRVFADMEADALWQVLRSWRRPKGRKVLNKDKIKIAYDADVCNCSGRDDTALANALLNGIVLALSFTAAINGCDLSAIQPWMIERTAHQVAISIVGDDSLVACYFDVENYRDAIEANIRKFGLVVKAESSSELCDVTYLGMMPYPVEGGMLQWGPTIGRRLYKAYWQREPDGSLPAWTRGVAQQMKLYRNVPILWELADQIDGLLQTHKVTRVTRDPNRVWSSRDSETNDYTDETIWWIARRYRSVGVTASMIHRDIKIIRSIEMLPAVVRLETVERIISKDDL